MGIFQECECYVGKGLPPNPPVRLARVTFQTRLRPFDFFIEFTPKQLLKKEVLYS